MDVCGAALASDDDEDTDGSATNDEGKADVDKDAFVFALDAEGSVCGASPSAATGIWGSRASR